VALADVLTYFRSYDKDAFAVFAVQGNEPTEDDLAAFEREIAGFRLPDEFREFTMSPLGGLYMEVTEEHWPRAKEFDVGPFWSFLYGLQVYGIAVDIPEWLDIRIETQRFRDDGIDDLVPFLRLVSDADCYCFDESGRILHWSHDEPEARRPEGVGFTELLMRELRELEDRLARKRRGEG
jgi:hypothetical protein